MTQAAAPEVDIFQDPEIKLWKKLQKEVTRPNPPPDQHDRIQAVIDALFKLEEEQNAKAEAEAKEKAEEKPKADA